MSFHSYMPRPPLSLFASSFWLNEGGAPASGKERLLPTGTTELVIHLRGEPLRIFDQVDPTRCNQVGRAIVCGPHSQPFVIDAAQKNAILSVHFKAGGAFPFLGMPASELHNMVVSLDDLWGAAANELREWLSEASAPQAKFQILEQFLLARATRTLQRHPAVAFALSAFQQRPHEQTVEALTDTIGLSSRRLSQLFGDEVGLTPTLFRRITRFQTIIRSVEGDPSCHWADLALACGYFDQAHFIHDFRSFSGMTPRAYLTQRGKQLNHLPLDT